MGETVTTGLVPCLGFLCLASSVTLVSYFPGSLGSFHSLTTYTGNSLVGSPVGSLPPSSHHPLPLHPVSPRPCGAPTGVRRGGGNGRSEDGYGV